jgi:hypothetical protein
MLLMLALRLRRGLAVLAFAAAASACTFPTVDYAADDGGVMCSVTGTCAETAQRCAEDGRREQIACVQRCNSKPGPTCLADCDKALSGALDVCAAACQSCGEQQGCANAAASCKTLVGSG